MKRIRHKRSDRLKGTMLVSYFRNPERVVFVVFFFCVDSDILQAATVPSLAPVYTTALSSENSTQVMAPGSSYSSCEKVHTQVPPE